MGVPELNPLIFAIIEKIIILVLGAPRLKTLFLNAYQNIHMRKKWGILCIVLLLSVCGFSQAARPALKFGKITPGDFTVDAPVVDSNTNAVILSDIGSSEFEGNSNGWFSLLFKRHRRIKIIDTKGFDAGTVSIRLYSNGTQSEKLQDLHAITHNLENGQVVSTKLESKDVFEDNVRRGYKIAKFSFPALKPGSVLEYSYTLKSDFLFNLQPWEFQGDYPVLYSEYQVQLPDFFNYVSLSQGYLAPERKTASHGQIYTVRAQNSFGPQQTYTITTQVADNTWTLRNVPALKEESFTSAIENHIAKIEFQLSQYRFPNQPVEDIMGTWTKVGQKLLASDDFGAAYTRENGWLDNELKAITKGAADDEAKARRIYEYVRDNFTCNSTYGTRLSEPNSLKEVFRKKSGRVSDINLLLLAMLRHESILARPVMLGLRERGATHPIYPLMDRYNYLICEVPLPDRTVYLDASRPMLGFSKLPASCYNGPAWVIDDLPVPVTFSADSLNETKLTSLILINNEKGGSVDGTVSSRLGDFASLRLRNKLSSTKMEDYTKELAKELSGDIVVDNVHVDSLKQYDLPVNVSYDFHMKTGDEDVIYFSPMLTETLKKNPFISATRHYPIEMPFKFDETFILDMEVPKGYAIDEIPKSVKYKFNENEGIFEYIFAKSPEHVQMRSRLAIYKANFSQDDYDSLREFFAFVIKKESEQIVFKKVKP